jgi:Ribonuclease G/E
MRLWKALQDAAATRDEPGIVYREPDLVEKTLRDAYKQASTRIIVDDEPCRKRIIRFLSLYYPRHEFIDEVVLHNRSSRNTGWTANWRRRCASASSSSPAVSCCWKNPRRSLRSTSTAAS